MRGFQIWSQNWNRTIFDPLFGHKQSKSGKSGYFASFWSFWTFFSKKEGQLLSDFNFEIRFRILLSRRNSLTPKWKKIDYFIFWPHSISKTSTNLRPPLHLTDRAKISHTVFWYYTATFETLTPCTSKKSFSVHPNEQSVAETWSTKAHLQWQSRYTCSTSWGTG